MAKRVREPIQVYLSPEERAGLDRAAHAMGVSHSEALRRGIQAIVGTEAAGSVGDLANSGYLTAPTIGPGGAPTSAPVVRLDDLLTELDGDRSER